MFQAQRRGFIGADRRAERAPDKESMDEIRTALVSKLGYLPENTVRTLMRELASGPANAAVVQTR
jgi:hypothetical protein